MHGGYDRGTQQGNLADLWAASLADNNTPSWQRLSPEGSAPSARAGHTLTAVSADELILFGGFGQQGLDDVHVLRVGPDGESSWRELTVRGDHSPGPRCAHAAVSVPCSEGRTRLISFGGYTTSHGADAALSLLTISECGTACSWEQLHAAAPDDDGRPPLPLQRSGHSAALASGERLLVFGGTCDDVRSGATHVLGDALCLDVDEEGLERLRHPEGGARWRRLAMDADDEEDLPRYNHAAALARHGDEEMLLVVGGSDESHSIVETAFALVVPPADV